MLVEYEYERMGGPLWCQAGLTRWQAKICNTTKYTAVLGQERKRSPGGGGAGKKFRIGWSINASPSL